MMKFIFLFAILLGFSSAELHKNLTEIASSSTDKPVYMCTSMEPHVDTILIVPNMSRDAARKLAHLNGRILKAQNILKRDSDGSNPLESGIRIALQRQLNNLVTKRDAILEKPATPSTSIVSNQDASRMESLMQYMSAIKANSAEKLRSCKEKAQPGIDLLNEYSAELLIWLASKTSEGMSFAREKAGEGLSLAGNKAAEGLNFAGQAVSGLATDAGDALLSFIKEHILDPRDVSEVRNRIGENVGELKDVFSTTLQDIIGLWAESCPAVKQNIWTILETIYQRNLGNSDTSLDTSNSGIAQRWSISSSLGSILGITAYNSFWTACNMANGIRKSVIPAGTFSYNLISFGYKKLS